MKTKFFIILTFSLVVLSNCKKDDKIAKNILISKTWKRGIVDRNPSSNPSGTILYEFVQNCDKDDTYKFSSDENLVINRFADKCDPNEPQIETLDYTINRTTKELVIDGIKYTIIEESQNQIKYYIIAPNGANFSSYLVFLLQ